MRQRSTSLQAEHVQERTLLSGIGVLYVDNVAGGDVIGDIVETYQSNVEENGAAPFNLQVNSHPSNRVSPSSVQYEWGQTLNSPGNISGDVSEVHVSNIGNAAGLDGRAHVIRYPVIPGFDGVIEVAIDTTPIAPGRGYQQDSAAEGIVHFVNDAKNASAVFQHVEFANVTGSPTDDIILVRERPHDFFPSIYDWYVYDGDNIATDYEYGDPIPRVNTNQFTRFLSGWGVGGDETFMFDHDGDGYSSVAIVSQSPIDGQNVVYIGGVPQAILLGPAGSKVVAGKFDDSGKDRLAYVIPNQGVHEWHIDLTGDGKPDYVSRWGDADGTPVAGKFFDFLPTTVTEGNQAYAKGSVHSLAVNSRYTVDLKWSDGVSQVHTGVTDSKGNATFVVPRLVSDDHPASGTASDVLTVAATLQDSMLPEGDV